MPPAAPTPPESQQFYRELASWWPLISAVEHYADEARSTAELLREAQRTVRSVLELGSGGGHNAAHLKDRYQLTLVDLSADMLAQSSKLNPQCEHILGDMRTVRLDRRFDAVLIHDAIDYMTTVADLQAAVATAAIHCNPGGLVLLMPDHTTETYAPGSDCGGGDAADGRSVRYLEWSWDPDPDDHWILTEYSFLLHHADGTTEAVHEIHKTGLFAPAVWLQTLTAQGLRARMVLEDMRGHADEGQRQPRQLFLGAVPMPEKGAS